MGCARGRAGADPRVPLPPRVPGGGDIFTDFAGGGYFYLDERDRAVIPTTSRHLLVVRETADGSGFELERDYDRKDGTRVKRVRRVRAHR